MADRADVKNDLEILRLFRNEVLRKMRAEGARVRKHARDEARKDTGNLRRRIKLKVGWDSKGPYARIVTTALRVSTSKAGRTTAFRYGLAQQQREQYLEKGLARTPRR